MDDEVMRLWLSSAANVSESGKWVQSTKALPSLDKKPNLKKEVAKFHKFVTIANPQGMSYVVPTLSMPASAT